MAQGKCFAEQHLAGRCRIRAAGSVGGVGVQQFPILFQRGADELAAGADICIGEELLERRFDGAFGDAPFGGNLFVRQSFDDELENLPVPAGEAHGGSVGHPHQLLQIVLFDAAAEFFGGVLVLTDAADAEADEGNGVTVRQAGGDKEDAAFEAGGFPLLDKGRDGLAFPFEIPDEDVDGLGDDAGFGFDDGAGRGENFDGRIRN
jgi:hypothetical protein